MDELKKYYHSPDFPVRVMEIGFLLLMIVMIYLSSLFYNNYQKAIAKRAVFNLSKLILTHRYETGSYPENISIGNDPWGEPYSYSYDVTKFAVWSKGKNKINNSTGTVPTTFGGDDIGFIFNESVSEKRSDFFEPTNERGKSVFS